MKKLIATLCAATLVLSFTACSNNSSSQTSSNQPSQNTSQGGDVSTPKTELIIGITKDIGGLDPHLVPNTLTQAVQANIYDWLIMRDKNDQIIPGLAEKWENINETTWKFTLKSGVKFHSGNPLTAEDVKFSLMRIQEERFPQRSNYIKIKEVKVIDELNFEIITDGPDPVLLNRISRLGSGILDSKLFKEIGEEAYLKGASGTGPYKFIEWVKDEKVVIEKNPNYAGPTPVWEKVTFKVVPEESTRVAELLTGGVDVALDMSPTDEERINSNEGTSVSRFPTKRIIYWVVRTSTKGLDNSKVREAIDLAIDDKLIVDQIYNGNAIPTRTMVAPSVLGSDESLCNTYLYDLEKAKKLVSELGDNVPEFEIATGNGQYLKDKEVTELVGAMLEQAGFKVKLNILETSRFTEIKNARGFTGLRMNGYSSSMSDASLDLQPFMSLSSLQTTDWANDEFIKLGKEALTTLDTNIRKSNYIKMQQIMAEERPIIPMFQVMGMYGISDKIEYTPRLDEMLYVDEIKPKA